MGKARAWQDRNAPEQDRLIEEGKAAALRGDPSSTCPVTHPGEIFKRSAWLVGYENGERQRQAEEVAARVAALSGEDAARVAGKLSDMLPARRVLAVLDGLAAAPARGTG